MVVSIDLPMGNRLRHPLRQNSGIIPKGLPLGLHNSDPSVGDLFRPQAAMACFEQVVTATGTIWKSATR